jgi:hypothetical protein
MTRNDMMSVKHLVALAAACAVALTALVASPVLAQQSEDDDGLFSAVTLDALRVAGIFLGGALVALAIVESDSSDSE